jgi:hypothetical protein
MERMDYISTCTQPSPPWEVISPLAIANKLPTYETECSLPSSQQLQNNPSPQTRESRPQHPLCSLKIRFNIICKKKVKQSNNTSMETQGRDDVQLLLIHDLGTRWGWVVSVTPRPRFSPGEGPPVPIVQETGWGPEPVWTHRLEENFLPLLGIEPRSPGRPVRSQTLYWLSYPAQYYPYVHVFQMLSSRQMFRPKVLFAFLISPCVLHASPILDLINSAWQTNLSAEFKTLNVT